MPGWEEGDWRDESLCQFKESNLLNSMGLEFYDLSHPWGLGQPCWPYFEDVKIERLHGMSRSGVLTQKITTVMHSGRCDDGPRLKASPLRRRIWQCQAAWAGTSFRNYQSTGKMVDGCSCGRKISLSSAGGIPTGKAGRIPRACICSKRSHAGRTSWRLNENDAFASGQWVGRVACGHHQTARWHCTISGRSLALSPHLKADVGIMTDPATLLPFLGAMLNGRVCPKRTSGVGSARHHSYPFNR